MVTRNFLGIIFIDVGSKHSETAPTRAMVE